MPSLADRVAETDNVLRESAEVLERLRRVEQVTRECLERSAGVTAESEEVIAQSRETRVRSRQLCEASRLVREGVLKTEADIRRRRGGVTAICQRN